MFDREHRKDIRMPEGEIWKQGKSSQVDNKTYKLTNHGHA